MSLFGLQSNMLRMKNSENSIKIIHKLMKTTAAIRSFSKLVHDVNGVNHIEKKSFGLIQLQNQQQQNQQSKVNSVSVRLYATTPFQNKPRLEKVEEAIKVLRAYSLTNFPETVEFVTGAIIPKG